MSTPDKAVDLDDAEFTEDLDLSCSGLPAVEEVLVPSTSLILAPSNDRCGSRDAKKRIW